MVGVLTGNRWKDEIFAKGIAICFERTVENVQHLDRCFGIRPARWVVFSHIIRDCKINSGSF